MKKYRLSYPESHRCGRWNYTLRSDGSICLHEFHGSQEEVHIPESLLGRPVTALSRCFSVGDHAQIVIIPPTVERIGANAFFFDDDLEAVLIPPQVAWIDETAFSGPTDLCLFVEEGSIAHQFACAMEIPHEVNLVPMLEDDNPQRVSGDWSYTLRENGEVILREYNGTEEKVTVPAQIDGHPVTELYDYAMRGNAFVREVLVQEGVRCIGSFAFAACSFLRRLILPDSVLFMHGGVCADCRDLEQVRLPARLETVQLLSFSSCASLKEVALPEGLRMIGPMAFAGCSALERIRVGPKLESVMKSAFLRCDRLRRPELPDTLDAQSREAFGEGCRED